MLLAKVGRALVCEAVRRLTSLVRMVRVSVNRLFLATVGVVRRALSAVLGRVVASIRGNVILKDTILVLG